GQGMQRRVVDSACGEICPSDAVMPIIAVIRSHICGVRANGHRIGEIYLLPARCRFIDERGRGEQRTSARPQVAHMCPGVVGTLVEPDARDVAVDIGCERNSKLYGRVRSEE